MEPTGPVLLSSFFNHSEKQMFDMKHSFYKSHENRFIHYNGYLIFKSYTGYLLEHSNNKKSEHYRNLWVNKNIYII